MKLLLFDVECSPNIGFTWGRIEQNVIEFIKEKEIISISWQWYPDPEIHVLALPDFSGYKPTVLSLLEPSGIQNAKLMAAFYRVIAKADLAVGHNIDGFDRKLTNTDFLLNKFGPPPSYKTVDTLKIARSQFAFQSNSLQALGVRLGLGKKVKHWGFELWKRCMAGDMKAWNLMKRYNQGDVTLLRKVYLRFLPWIKNHPDMNLMDNHVGCPACKGIHLQRRGFGFSSGRVFRKYVCMDCGKWSHRANTLTEKYK